jgi:hypothetical protein
MSLLAGASTLYGMVYGFTPKSRRDTTDFDFSMFFRITTPLLALKLLSTNDIYYTNTMKPSRRLLVACIGAPILSYITFSTGYLIGKAAANAVAPATEPVNTDRVL